MDILYLTLFAEGKVQVTVGEPANDSHVAEHTTKLKSNPNSVANIIVVGFMPRERNRNNQICDRSDRVALANISFHRNDYAIFKATEHVFLTLNSWRLQSNIHRPNWLDLPTL
jgi:hypothetical protein